MTSFANGRYRPRGPTSHGGTGSIIICTDTYLDRDVAIKFLQPRSEKRRILDEIAALQRIRSKNVVEIYDIVIASPDNRIGLVQEFLPGKGLDELAPLPPSDRLRVLFQIANGLADIHEQGQIHRDLKPNNMRLDGEGLVNIFDFDLSRQEGPTALTRGFRGTPGFAAPELYSFGPVILEKSADIYSYAATALFLLTGDLPDELKENKPDPQTWLDRGGFSAVAADLGEEVVTSLNGCLSPAPTQRPTAQRLRDLLAAMLLRGKHRAQIIFGGAIHVCHSGNPRTRIRIGDLGEMMVIYNGLGFTAKVVSGSVSINNIPLTSAMEIPGCCVLGFGGSELPAWTRKFVTLDISHPEVVL